MTFISYAQNQEDVFLFRAFKHLPTGFYVDVGANDPMKDSVTQAFYERTWQGINIDPVPYWHQRLQQKRKRDINLAVAISDRQGQFEFYELPETGLSTFSLEQAESHRRQGQVVRQVNVKTRTLAEILDQFTLPAIHFLKIDVEGAEGAVIRGANWQKHRPWIIVIESTIPNTNTSVHEPWEATLFASQYHFVWFDGLNRFYIADEHKELDSAFLVPINVLDNYVAIDTFNLRVGARELEMELRDLESLRSRALAFEVDIERLNEGIASARVAFENAYALANCRSCRIARAVVRLPLAVTKNITAKSFGLLKGLLRRLYAWLQRYPRLRNKTVRLMQSFPRLEARMRRLVGLPGQTPWAADGNLDQSSLAPDELKVYQQITGS